MSCRHLKSSSGAVPFTQSQHTNTASMHGGILSSTALTHRPVYGQVRPLAQRLRMREVECAAVRDQRALADRSVHVRQAKCWGGSVG